MGISLGLKTLALYLKDFDRDAFDKFEKLYSPDGIGTLASARDGFFFEDMFIGPPQEPVDFSRYDSIEDEDEIIKREKRRLQKEYANLLPGVKFKVEYNDWYEVFYMFPTDWDRYKFVSRTLSTGMEVFEHLSRKGIDANLLSAASGDPDIAGKYRVELINLLPYVNAKNPGRRLAEIVLGDSSPACRHAALGALYNENEVADISIVRRLVSEIPKLNSFLSDDDLHFSFVTLLLGAAKKIRGLENRFVELLEYCEGRIEEELKTTYISILPLVSIHGRIFLDGVKSLIEYNPEMGTEYVNSLNDNKNIRSWTMHEIDNEFNKMPFHEKVKFSKFITRKKTNDMKWYLDQCENNGWIERPKNSSIYVISNDNVRGCMLHSNENLKAVNGMRNAVITFKSDRLVEQVTLLNGEAMEKIGRGDKGFSLASSIKRVNEAISEYRSNKIPSLSF